MAEPEVWLRGPVAGIAPELQPVAHALLQAREDVRELLNDVPPERLWRVPGSAAHAAFHVLHLAGTLERLLTYARGEMLTDEQLAARKAEASTERHLSSVELIAIADRQIDAALKQVRNTAVSTLGDAREVGRKRLPATVRGLLFHAAEHTTRHVGQLSTTLRVLA
jgi:uncharacterized damage-inducible protein DinB